MDEPWRKLSSRELRGNSISFPAVKKFKILDYVQSFENHGITATSLLSIQISSSGQCRVTFAQQSFASSICKHGLRMDGSHIFPIAVDESLHSVQIHIHDVPIWVSNAAVESALSEYGTVLGAIRHGRIKVRENVFVASGIRFAAFKFLPGRTMPSYVKTRDGKGTFRVFHQDQQPTCRICSSNDHLARDCPKQRPQLRSQQPSQQPQPPLGASDHIVISGDIKYKTKQLNYVSKPNRTSWKWSQDAVGRLRQALLTTNLLPEVPHNRSVNGFWSHWKHKVISLAEQHCKTPPRLPNTQQRQSPSRPWITKDLLTGIKLKHKLYRTYLHDRSAHNWESFTSQRNKVTTMLRRAKSTFVLSQSHPDNFSHSNLHKVVKCLKTKTCTPIPDLINQSQNAKTPLSKATMLNNFFIQQSQQSVSNCNNEIPRINTTPTITSTLTNFKTTPTDVEDLLQQLDTSKSNGSDGIPTRLLKEAASELAPSLSALFNLSFETGQTPQEWRDATVTPIHKKGTKSSPTNYRPISLLPVVSKVQERVVYNRLYSHIQQHLPTHQSGFRQCDGTELQLARINHEISAHRDSGHHVSACFFDLSKAFDRVWHPGLLKKLSHYGVEAEAHIWLTGYLSGRRQRVQVDGTVSPWLGVPAGVPQGSVLGPLLFLTYTIDLPNACINDDTTCSQFADDTALIASTSSPQQTEQQLQRAVTSAAKWLNDWHLLVNIDKTVTMTFYHDNRPPAHLPTLFLNDSPLKTVRQQRHLGVIFQHNLQWSTHVNNIINKSLKVLHMLTKLRNSLNSSALSYLYCTYIRPILEYACIAVTPLPHNILDRLERIQRKAARICLHLPLFSPVDHSSLLHRLQLPTLFSRRRIKQLLLSHSIFHHYAPPHLLQLQLPPLAANVYSLRRPRSYHLPTSRTDRLKDSPIFRALHYFNSLPDAMKSIKDRTMFKSEIHSLFVSSICPCSDHPLPYV